MITEGLIDKFAAGDELPVQRTVTDIPAGVTVTRAWLKVTARQNPDWDADTDAQILKEITTTAVSGVGHISDDGADGTAVLDFRLTSADTTPLGSRVAWFYAVKVELSTGATRTLETGEIKPERQAVQAPVT